MVVNCCCNDLRQIKSPTGPQQQNENEPNRDVERNKSEQILSVYELLSDECELNIPGCSEDSSNSKARDTSCKSGGKSLKVLKRIQTLQISCF